MEAGEEARVRQSGRDWILSHYYLTFLTKISLKEVYVWVHSLRGFCLSWHPGGKAWLQGQLAAGHIASVVRKQPERNAGAVCFLLPPPPLFSTRTPAYEVAEHTFRLHFPSSVKPLGANILVGTPQVCLLGNSKSMQVVED